MTDAETNSVEPTTAEVKSVPKRTAIVLEPEIQDQVAVLARTHKLPQGLVIQTMIDMVRDKPEFIAALQAKRVEKVSNRTGKTALLKRLAKLSAEELEALTSNIKV